MSALAVAYLPAAWPAAGALAIALLPPAWARGLAKIVASGLGALTVYVAWASLAEMGPWDGLSLWLLLPGLGLAALGLWASDGFLVREAELDGPDGGARDRRRYLALYSVFAATIALVACATSLLLMWVAVEGTTLASVLLVAHPRLPTSVEAAWKYLVATSVGGLLALLGTVFVAYSCHLSLGAPPSATPALLASGLVSGALVAFAFAAIGFGTKVGLSPMHGWLPDAHSEAPAPVSALLSGIELATILYALMRLERIVRLATGSPWAGDLLIVLGLLSLLLAALFVGAQRDLKRAFAYSSVEHLGLIALGVGVGGAAVVGALLHVWTHAFTKSGLFLAAGNVRHRFGLSAPPAADRLIARLPLSGWAIALGTWGIAGMPPFGPFFSEWLVVRGAVLQGDSAVAIVAVALLAAVAVGLGVRVPRMVLGGRAMDRGHAVATRRWESASEAWPMVALTVLGIVAGIGAPLVFGGTLAHAVGLLAGGGAR